MSDVHLCNFMFLYFVSISRVFGGAIPQWSRHWTFTLKTHVHFPLSSGIAWSFRQGCITA